MKILVVDDDVNVRRVCERALRQAGHEVAAAASASEAMERLPEEWDIILSDLRMPGPFSGMDLARKARERGNTDVILMTGFPELHSAIQAIREGAYDYLIKPFTPEVLHMTVQRCVNKRNLSIELLREKALRTQLEEAHRRLTRMQKVQETFGQFATPEVAQFVLSHPQDFWRSGELCAATVLFADIRRFTPFAQNAAPHETVQALNRIFACAIEAVHGEGGILNKFMGDGLLALFGAPVRREDHPAAAAKAALQLRAAVEALTSDASNPKRKALRVGIGINTGSMVAGCIGTKDRTEYSVIGHSVNIGARLEKLAAEGQILAGPETARRLKRDFRLVSRGKPPLAGVSQAIEIFELLGPK